ILPLDEGGHAAWRRFRGRPSASPMRCGIRAVLQPSASALFVGLLLTSCLRAAGGVREWRVYGIEGRSRSQAYLSFAAYPWRSPPSRECLEGCTSYGASPARRCQRPPLVPADLLGDPPRSPASELPSLAQGCRR